MSQEDQDDDGIPDRDEAADAARLMPQVYGALADEGCPTAALLYRVSPHPDDVTLRVLRGVLVFEEVCAPLSMAVGHAAAFALTYDPAASHDQAAAQAMTISAAGACAFSASCSACADAPRPCDLEPAGAPRLHLSARSHRLYLDEPACALDLCSGPHTCGVERIAFPSVNVGEPLAPRVGDLTAAGIITAANGWQAPALFDHDPWGGAAFGAAGPLRPLLDAPAPAPCP